MKGFCIFLLALLLFTTGCDLRQREEALQKKEAILNDREQSLLLREKTLQLREEEVLKREQHLDSTMKQDTTRLVQPALIGRWDVKMTCTEATCPGSAIGDTKTEVWEFSYAGTTLMVKAIASEKLVRVYTGFYTGNTIELVEERPGTDSEGSTKMVIRLRLSDDTHMEGQREIIRENDCRVVYSLQLQKQNQ